MYKVLLVDDEVLTREAIRQNIPWEEAGFLLIGVAENGKEALDMIEEEQPDVVLTDICMPVMDGIALTACIYERYPRIKVIIISGYDDFEYAKQAIRYEVSNYILKPITAYELIEELKKVKDKIAKTIEKQSELEQVQYEFRKNLPTIRNHFLNQLVEGSYIKNDAKLQMQKLNLRLSGHFQAVVMLEVEDSSAFWENYPTAKKELIDFSVANVSEEIIGEHSHIIFFKNVEEKSMFIFAHNSEEELITLIQETCRHIVTTIYQCMEIKVCTLVGKTVQDLKDWEISYHSVLTARENRFFLEEHEFVFGTNFSPEREQVQLLLTQQMDKLVLMIKMNQAEEIESITRHIFESLRNSGKEKMQMILTIQNLVLAILISLDEKREEKFILQILEYKHLADVEKWFLKFCISLAEDISNKRESVNQKLAARAIDYMEKNYMNAGMSLNMICDFLGVSTSHFSAFFKSATGKTFTEALTCIRIKKAKQLFEKSGMMNYEVALSVGYQDPHYFSSVFKKYVGLTPSEYGKQLGRGKRDRS